MEGVVWVAGAVALIAALVNPLALVAIWKQVAVVGAKVDATHDEVARLRDSEVMNLRKRVHDLSSEVAVLKARLDMREGVGG